MDVSTALVLLEQESSQLDSIVAPLAAADWQRSTPAAGWNIADQIAHLHWTDTVAHQSAQGDPAFDRMVERVQAEGSGFIQEVSDGYAALPPADLLSAWRDGRKSLVDALTQADPGSKLSWFGPPMRPVTMVTARIMETWAHGLDVCDALQVEKPADTPLIAVTRIGFRTLGFSFVSHGEEAPEEPVRVALTMHGGELLEYGPEDAANTVTGSAWGFAAVVTQRRHIDDVDLEADGPVARRWMEIAQAFAGSPTLGPAAGERTITAQGGQR